MSVGSTISKDERCQCLSCAGSGLSLPRTENIEEGSMGGHDSLTQQNPLAWIYILIFISILIHGVGIDQYIFIG